MCFETLPFFLNLEVFVLLLCSVVNCTNAPAGRIEEGEELSEEECANMGKFNLLGQ